ncbi:MAG: phosphoribosylformylglycinamidine synthase [Bacilli bacterium]
MVSKRIFVEKKSDFDLESKVLISDIEDNLGIHVKSIRVINIYDLIDVNNNKINMYINEVLTEPVTDIYFDKIDLKDSKYLATEFLPGQFCQCSQSAMECIKLIDDEFDGDISVGKLFIFEGINDFDLNRIKGYLVNPVESREKDLSVIGIDLDVEVDVVKTINGFNKMCEENLKNLLSQYELAMDLNDLKYIQEYFVSESRDITETELKLLDTYWSDHCRHTTFETSLTNITFENGNIKYKFQEIFNRYLDIRLELGRSNNPITLMDMATICSKYQRKLGILDNLEVSEEINASSIFVNVDVDGEIEKWLLMLKNETHNHPTEIEPYGGASTCIGGAIRDPLSGRSYVYQAMRISGSGNPLQKVSDTLKYKLPQRTISKLSALGNSSYGNQIGIPTTYVREIIDKSYTAKHLEVGAVVGAIKADNIKRETPTLGDVIILLGGKTGRDGIGGATGSSKSHDEKSLEKLGAQVQKGNAIEERKIQRLFRNPKVTKMIKRCNDFGAGGVAVSIGEIADSIEIDLNAVPLKYQGLNGTEITLSESQERMSVVVKKEDAKEFIKLSENENLSANIVAFVTDNGRLKIKWNNDYIVDISRDFINTNGIRKSNDVYVENINTENILKIKKELSKENVYSLLREDNVACQKGLDEMFDSTIGRTTVLMPYGGKNYLTKTQVSVQKVPVLSKSTTTCSILSYGFNPRIASKSAFHSAIYAVIDSVTKIVSAGGSLKDIRLSFQEYFEKLGDNPKKWGKPFQALLGGIYAQDELNISAIGGKDSMSGTFQNLDVIPTLISFALCPSKTDQIISPEFKNIDNYIYLYKHNISDDGLPDFTQLKKIYADVEKNIKAKTILSAYSIEYGLIEALIKMSFGNDIGVNIETNQDMFNLDYGSIVVESTSEINDSNAILLGKTSSLFKVNTLEFNLQTLKDIWSEKFSVLYKIRNSNNLNVCNKMYGQKFKKTNDASPKAFIPVFPGTNCEYDMQAAFLEEDIPSEIFVFNNQSTQAIKNSIIEMENHINNSTILILSGGFSAADEPDGSGKYIASILKSPKVREAIENLIDRGGLIIGICNGFQALVKCGLLPYGKFDSVDCSSPTLFKNKISRHLSQFVTTKVVSVNSPWLNGFEIGDTHKLPISHGEGQFVVSDELAKKLFDNGQVAFCYCDENGNITGKSLDNPNDSSYSIEGIISPCGQILGKMAHSERVDEMLYKNIANVCKQTLAKNARHYFNGGNKNGQ